MNASASAVRFAPGPRPPGTPAQLPRLEPRWLALPSTPRLFYLRGGDPHGTPLLFIHGIEGWAEQWLPTLTTLSGYRWLIPDLPGFGRSSPMRRADRESFCRALLELLDAEGVERAVVMGNSLGGGLALSLAADHPERVERLVLATAAGILRQVALPLRLARLPLLGRLMLANYRSLLKLRWKLQFGSGELVTREFVNEVWQFLDQHDCRSTYQGLIKHSANLFGLTDVLTDRLPSIQQPLLLVWGTRDRVLPLEHAYYAARTMPNVRLEIFEGCGHYPHWEQSARFNALVEDFLGIRPGSACA